MVDISSACKVSVDFLENSKVLATLSIWDILEGTNLQSILSQLSRASLMFQFF